MESQLNYTHPVFHNWLEWHIDFNGILTRLVLLYA